MAFFDGRLFRWLRRLAGDGLLAGRAAHLLGGLSHVSGVGALRGFAEFMTLVDDALAKMVARLERARRWLREPDTTVLVVSSVSDEAAATAAQLRDAVRALAIEPRGAVLNRALPPSLLASPPRADEPPAALFARYAAAYACVQARVQTALAASFADVRAVPLVPEPAAAARLDTLARIGAHLLDGS
jgi:hypothetical protein